MTQRFTAATPEVRARELRRRLSTAVEPFLAILDYQ
jgi:hypothetical protein